LGVAEAVARVFQGSPRTTPESDPAAARTYYLSALARLDRADRAGAIELLTQALERDDFLLDAYHALAVIHDQQENPSLSLLC